MANKLRQKIYKKGQTFIVPLIIYVDEFSKTGYDIHTPRLKTEQKQWSIFGVPKRHSTPFYDI